MKNYKLIELLQAFNPNANVTTSISEDIALSYITGGGRNQEYDKKDTPVIFIEPVYCLCCHNYDNCEHPAEVCEKFILEEAG